MDDRFVTTQQDQPRRKDQRDGAVQTGQPAGCRTEEDSRGDSETLRCGELSGDQPAGRVRRNKQYQRGKRVRRRL